MFKKFLTIMGVLMFGSGLFSPMLSRTALGQANGTTPPASPASASCTFPWTSCLHPNIPDADWGATFGTKKPEEAGQNLYKNTLQMTRVDPGKKAFKNTTGAFGTSESNMVRLLNNDLGPIMEKSPYLTQSQAAQKMAQIQQRYQEEKEIFELQADIDAAVTPSEIFANGDTSDSGFDLINDLNNIEKILFNKVDPIDIGGNFDASSSGGSESPSAPGTSGSKTPAAGSESTGTTSGALSGSEPDQGSGNGPGDQGSSQQSSGNKPPAGNNSGNKPQTKPSATENPNICFADDKLDKALRDFDDQKLVNPALKENEKTQPPPEDNGSAGGSGGSENPGGSGGAGGSGGNGSGDESIASTSQALKGPGEYDYNPPTQPTVEPAPSSNWFKNPPCNDVMCIQVNFVKKPASTYVDADNCIACHAEKINEKLKETINHSLIPGKATGNLFEPGICKQAASKLFEKVGIGFYKVSKPIITPTNDDLIYGNSIVDEWDKFVNSSKPFPFYSKNIPDPKNSNADTSIPSIQDRASKSAISNATPDTTVSQLSNSIQAEVKSITEKLSLQVSVASPAVQSDVDSGFFQSIRGELDQMNFYFDGFKNLLQRIHEKVGDLDENHACQVIPKIEQCK